MRTGVDGKPTRTSSSLRSAAQPIQRSCSIFRLPNAVFGALSSMRSGSAGAQCTLSRGGIRTTSLPTRILGRYSAVRLAL